MLKDERRLVTKIGIRRRRQGDENWEAETEMLKEIRNMETDGD